MLVTAMDHSQRRLSMGMMNSHHSEAEYLDLANHQPPPYSLSLEHSHSMGMPHGHYWTTAKTSTTSRARSCRYGAKCQFAHGMPELRHVLRHPKYKTTKCKSYWGSGHCPYGSRCRFIHEEEPVGRSGSMYKSSGLSPRNEISPTSQGDLSFLNAQYNSDLPAANGLMSYNSDLGMLNGQSSPTWLSGEVASTPTFLRSPSEQTNVLDQSVEYNGLQDAIGVLLKFSQSFPDNEAPAPTVGASSPKVGLPPTVPAGSSLKSPLKRDLSLQADELWKDFSAVSIGGSGDATDTSSPSDWFLSSDNGGLGGADLREDSASRLSFFTQFK
ncbi:hypothetical protein SPRG_03462 [Saprolegnia parasitica CBS 223.65]|uniref:C3H1-type domain-containing protein n=1 Tax=Saprolegnia parasitica (strain CBS 223.65) TaxID=695850 RepID=A0A067CLF6_SAPPC|nr:hypothetical protein SPRG_03462 [Saprolegnia parasitica CBS 223.65]KDO31534.1 hypothetical protein SPRG_03462 [Saprolegnia parasitica CBS 223.65]|eukprot:XP_012197444.1 hypothetical protein SPRG_03462 [Saprolegnia parasitica CBS 223.65]